LVRWHHECWNGRGYPDALRREEIPLAARVLRVADCYAALTDVRPFRSALSVAQARKEISVRAGIEFDPAVVSAFLSLEYLQELDSYATDGSELSLPTDPEKTDNWNMFSSIS
jgi:HD-GYP domain-containing protein (c-di-GMP phosphodiesterase class II)